MYIYIPTLLRFKIIFAKNDSMFLDFTVRLKGEFQIKDFENEIIKNNPILFVLFKIYIFMIQKN
jgi:hypothetical protein